MPYPPNTIQWPIGTLVIHAADAKRPEMLMRVVSYTPEGLCRTVYHQPSHRMSSKHQKQAWANDIASLLDPRDFNIPLTPIGDKK